MVDEQIIAAFEQGFEDATQYGVWGSLYSDACEAQQAAYRRGHFAGQQEIALQD